jgi:PKD repeat protein
MYRITPGSSGVALFDCGGSDAFGNTANCLNFLGNGGDGLRHFAFQNFGNVINIGLDVSHGQSIHWSYINFGTNNGNWFNDRDGDLLELDHCWMCKYPGNGNAVWNGADNTHPNAYDHILVHDNVFLVVRDNNMNGGMGDDCINLYDGESAYNNLMVGIPYSGYSSGQHMDGCQNNSGAYTKCYNNVCINFGQDLVFDYLMTWGGMSHVRIYNNIIAYTNSVLTGTPARGITLLADVGASQSYSDVLIANNLMVDLGSGRGGTNGANAGIALYNTTFANSLVANNVSVNLWNLYPFGSGGATNYANYGDYTNVNTASNFVTYVQYGTANNFNLTSNSMFRGVATNLTSWGITTDIAGNPRPSTGNWDAGPYQYVTVGSTNIPPTASFTGTPTTGLAPLTVAFTGSATGSTPFTWLWNFGDSQTSTSQSPSHTYASAGTNTVSLTAMNAYGTNTSTSAGYIVATNAPAPPPSPVHVTVTGVSLSGAGLQIQ